MGDGDEDDDDTGAFSKNFGASFTISMAPNGAVITMANTATIKIILAN